MCKTSLKTLENREANLLVLDATYVAYTSMATIDNIHKHTTTR